MSKSIKFKNDNYLDSTSIVHNRQLLSDILNIQEIPINFNTDYIYLSDLQYICVKIGKLVILNIHTIAFKQLIPNSQSLITGLPCTLGNNIIFYLFGGNGASGQTLRLALIENGNIQTHWAPDVVYGDSSNKQYSGILIYKTSQ